MFGRATITLGIGPHSSLVMLSSMLYIELRDMTVTCGHNVVGKHGVLCEVKR